MAHRNARLNVFGRELLCRRIAEQDWSVTAAARPPASRGRRPSKWLARYRDEGLAGLEDRSSRPRRLRARVTPRGPAPHLPSPPSARGPAPHQLGDRHRPLDRLPGAGPQRPRASGGAGARAAAAGAALRARPAGRPPAPRHQASRADRTRRRQALPRLDARARAPRHRPRGRARRRRRPLAARLRRGAARRDRRLDGGVRGQRLGLLRGPRDHGAAGAHRQRLLLHEPGLPRGARAARASRRGGHAPTGRRPTARPRPS